MSRFSDDLLERARRYVRGEPEPTPEPEPASLADLAMPVALALIRRFEGFYSHPYLCSAGVPTIGYGATRYLDGRAVQLTDPPISREAAERLLLLQVRRIYLPAVLRLCPGVRDADRLAALIDFCFNLGPGALAASTLRKRVNDERWDEVPRELMRWVYAAGKKLRGLVLRREAEAGLI